MLSLLDYHLRTIQYFKQQNAVWDFFANHQHKAEQLKEFKTDLLKNTYKFDLATETALYSNVEKAKEKLGLTIPVYLYQAQHSDEMNATIVYLENEAHVVFSGRILELLDGDEKEAIIAHELSHIKLYTELNGDAEVADRIITAIANNTGSTPAHYETARLFSLFTEIFCDRGAYLVMGNYAPIISSLVKISTGLQTVNAESYIKQAEEIFSLDSQTKASGVSHPENFIRARAIWLWHKDGSKAEASIQQMIEGYTSFEELDIFRQHYLAQLTKQVIQLLLQPSWMNTAHTTSLAKQYFGDIQLTGSVDKDQLKAQTEVLHSNTQDYLAYVLYDFATADKSLEHIPLGYSFFLADELKIDKSFSAVVKKERKLSDKRTGALKKQLLTAFHEQV